MAALRLTDPLRGEYQRLFDTCDLRPEREAEVQAILARVQAGRPRYDAVAQATGVPWHAIALIHQMECSGRFDRHLHNGDPLGARTVHVPAGRPVRGNPPFTWEASAEDALRFDRFDRNADWSLPSLLYQLECYNGTGYRRFHPECLSPYLWSGSSHYSQGKYIEDGRWSDTAVSKQIGAAVLLRRMAETGQVAPATELPAGPVPVTLPGQAPGQPLLRYAPDVVNPHGKALQAFLNTLPDIYLKVDGKLGTKSSDAFRAVTGHYLAGDPRAGA